MSTKQALVTGAAGFVGRHFAHELRRRGWEVVGIDVTDARPGGALEIFRHGLHTFNLVVHAAARAPHRAAIDGQPASHVYNQLLDAAMFDWAIRTGQGRVLYLSSAAAYPVDLQAAWRTSRKLWEGDTDPDDNDRDSPYSHEPDAVYGWTKLTGERLAASARAAGVPVTVVRPFSGYGQDQGTDWPFGAFLDRVRHRADPFLIWGDGSQVRDWVHIDDVVAGALAVVESGTDDPVNLCTGIGTSMLELAGLMFAEAGHHPRVLCDDVGKPSGVAYRVGDPTRMQKYYTPTMSIADGVKRALAAAG